MPKKEAPLEYLKNFIPTGSEQLALELLRVHKVHLTITRERSSILGDYRHASGRQHHRISVNGNLNKYSFLITLIHELAHLIAHLRFRDIRPHGPEWQITYGELLARFIDLQVFPADLVNALRISMKSAPASSCSDDGLMRVLKRYDTSKKLMLEQLPEGKLFSISRGQVFQKGKKLRKRFECTDVNSGKIYLFSPIYEVEAV